MMMSNLQMVNRFLNQITGAPPAVLIALRIGMIINQIEHMRTCKILPY